MYKILFITGAPASGKSTISKLVAEKLSGLTYIGTDLIREVLRSQIPITTNPGLHTKAILASKKSLDLGGSPVQGFIDQATALAPGISALTNRAIHEDLSLLLEGIHLIPAIVNIPETPNYRIIPVVLRVETEEQHLQQMALQGSDRSKGKVENIKIARYFQDYLEVNAPASKFHIVVNRFNQQQQTADEIVGLLD